MRAKIEKERQNARREGQQQQQQQQQKQQQQQQQQQQQSLDMDMHDVGMDESEDAVHVQIARSGGRRSNTRNRIKQEVVGEVRMVPIKK